MSGELMPCPVCGAEPRNIEWNHVDRRFQVSCIRDSCGLIAFDESQSRVVEIWNHRTPGPATKVVLEKLKSHPPHWGDKPSAQVLGSLTCGDVIAFLNEWEARKEVAKLQARIILEITERAEPPFSESPSK